MNMHQMFKEFESNEIQAEIDKMMLGEYREILEIKRKKRIIHKIFRSEIGVFYKKSDSLKKV